MKVARSAKIAGNAAKMVSEFRAVLILRLVSWQLGDVREHDSYGTTEPWTLSVIIKRREKPHPVMRRFFFALRPCPSTLNGIKYQSREKEVAGERKLEQDKLYDVVAI
ncbi:hypothetical protein JTE90_016172 [Oedothorax gibbosus]|uniref:Uncharacterized protein n=1 Tax=Oedothorax gibbosus TaxID=931172 RepID=A0AAV6UTF4_9ARAC|nr:hypothetical protein JTE90_016172 [Oedothorax gibbosus]